MFEGQTNLYRIDVNKGMKTKILSKNGWIRPYAVNNEHILYFLQEKESSPIDHNIIKYNIATKKVGLAKIPQIKKLSIRDDFTVSPNERFAIVSSNGYIYIIDLVKQKCIDQFNIPGINIDTNQSVGEFSWKTDGSYVIFSVYSSSNGCICKYTFPQN